MLASTEPAAEGPQFQRIDCPASRPFCLARETCAYHEHARGRRRPVPLHRPSRRFGPSGWNLYRLPHLPPVPRLRCPPEAEFQCPSSVPCCTFSALDGAESEEKKTNSGQHEALQDVAGGERIGSVGNRTPVGAARDGKEEDNNRLFVPVYFYETQTRYKKKRLYRPRQMIHSSPSIGDASHPGPLPAFPIWWGPRRPGLGEALYPSQDERHKMASPKQTAKSDILVKRVCA